MKKFIFSAFWFVIVWPCFATASAQIGVEGGPIEIRAQELEVINSHRRATYRGNVIAYQGEATLQSERLTIHFAKNEEGTASEEVTDIPAIDDTETTELAEENETGLAAQFGQPTRFVAETDVVYSTSEETAVGDFGVYDFVTDTITLTGNVALNREGSWAIGKKLVINVGDGRSYLDGDSQTRVNSRFQLEE